MILPAYAIAKMIGIQSSDETLISTLLTDSRDLTFPAESLFFALRTSGNDGHRFISQLIERGVKHFVVERKPDDAPEDCQFWVVADVLAALQQIATKVREMFPDLPVVGITGSRGKTVVKELLYRIVRADRLTARSPRSYNSQIGVPMSIWGLSPETTLAIIEAGISQPGEMQKLQAMIQPTIGIFTSLTDEHAEGFESLQQKAQEKAILFKDCTDIFIPVDQPIIESAVRAQSPDARIHTVEGDNRQMALAAAQYVLGYVIPEEMATSLSEKISPRIDVCETLKDCLIVYDGFTNDLRSVGDALNFTERHAPAQRPVTLILGCPLCEGHAFGSADWHELRRVLEAKGVKRLIGIGFPTEYDYPNSQWVGTVADFLANYTISDFQEETILVKGDGTEGFEEIKTLLEAPRHETVMEVDLGAITRNFNYFRSKVKPGTGLVAMVKAAGYGVGAVELAKTLQSQGAAYLAVAVVDEGAELRRAGITMPIIVMNPIGTNYKALFENRLEPSVFSIRELDLLVDNARRLGIKDYPVHIKLDTGMHRLGFTQQQIPELIEALKAQDEVKVRSIFSHLATADCLDEDEYTHSQLEAFRLMSTEIMAALPYRPMRHILNTAGIMRYPEHHYDMVRLGIGLYGVSPVPQIDDSLEVVATLSTTIISIKEWGPGTTIGYGRRGKVTQPSVIATIPIGYADGLDRHLSCGQGKVVINGKECPIVGNICMDQCMVDVTDADAHIGDKVEIFGHQMPVECIAATLSTIPYEILTSISPRVKRIYFRD
ncbi:MAG: alanine racemase [Bacteroidales bacterium]|nr:alanine racemase [Bacteroidales bacterium]